MVVPVWFTESQLPPSFKSKKKGQKCNEDLAYAADVEQLLDNDCPMAKLLFNEALTRFNMTSIYFSHRSDFQTLTTLKKLRV